MGKLNLFKEMHFNSAFSKILVGAALQKHQDVVLNVTCLSVSLQRKLSKSPSLSFSDYPSCLSCSDSSRHQSPFDSATFSARISWKVESCFICSVCIECLLISFFFSLKS